MKAFQKEEKVVNNCTQKYMFVRKGNCKRKFLENVRQTLNHEIKKIYKDLPLTHVRDLKVSLSEHDGDRKPLKGESTLTHLLLPAVLYKKARDVRLDKARKPENPLC